MAFSAYLEAMRWLGRAHESATFILNRAFPSKLKLLRMYSWRVTGLCALAREDAAVGQRREHWT
jgi:hypothetical protein